jgi:hypothetical protein
MEASFSTSGLMIVIMHLEIKVLLK